MPVLMPFQKTVFRVIIPALIFFMLGCQKPQDNGGGGGGTPLAVPTVTTAGVSTITNNSALAGGTVTSDGGSAVTERGVCYSTGSGPTTSNNKLQIGTGNGSFDGTISSLAPNTLYYVRAYAINTVGTSYGNQQSFTTSSVAPPPPVPVDSALSLYIGGGQSLYAFNARTGDLKWQKNLGDNVFSSPVYSNGKVYVGCANKKLFAYDTLGNSVWTATTSSRIGHQSPIVKNGIVYINTEQSRDIYAYNAETGNLLWQYNATEPGMTVFGGSDLAIYDNTLFINSGYLYAIDATTGILKWKYLNGGDVTPVKLNNKLYFNTFNHSLVALDVLTGNFLWEKASISVFDSPKCLNAGNGKLFYSDDTFICALDTTTGSVIWQTSTFISSSLQPGYSPILIGDSAYFRTNAKVTLYNAQNGAYIWQALAQDVTGNMTIVNNVLYYSSEVTVGPITKYHLFAVDLSSPNTYQWVSAYGASSPYLISAPCVITKSGKAHRFGKVFN